jgi:hypothetical protein
MWHTNSSIYSKIRGKSEQNNTSSVAVKDTAKLFTHWRRAVRFYVEKTVGVKLGESVSHTRQTHALYS